MIVFIVFRCYQQRKRWYQCWRSGKPTECNRNFYRLLFTWSPERLPCNKMNTYVLLINIRHCYTDPNSFSLKISHRILNKMHPTIIKILDDQFRQQHLTRASYFLFNFYYTYELGMLVRGSGERIKNYVLLIKCNIKDFVEKWIGTSVNKKETKVPQAGVYRS